MSTQKHTQQSGIRINLFISTPQAILIGSFIIAVAILINGGIIRFKGSSTKSAASAQTAQAPTQPTGQGAQAPVAPSKVDASIGHLPVKGSHTAKVAVIEWGDFRCPFCERFFQQTEPSVLKDYVDSGKVVFAFRNFQFLGPASVTAGNAAECANEQGKFWEYHDYLYKNQPQESDTAMFNSDKLTSIAQGLGLDSSKFKSCLDATKYSKNLTTDQSDGQTAGVTGTPSFVIGKLDSTRTKVVGGQVIIGAQPYTAIKAAIDQQLQ